MPTVPDPAPGRTLPGPAVVALALAGVAVATGLVAALGKRFDTATLGVLYVLPVLLVSARSGAIAGAATAVVAVAAFDFFTLPPTFELRIADREEWVAVAVLLVTAVGTARIAEAARRAARAEARARVEADLAADLARLVLSGPDREGARRAVDEHLSAALGAEVRLTLAEPHDPADPAAPRGTPPAADGGDLGDAGPVVLRDDRSGELGRLEGPPGDAATRGALVRLAPAVAALLVARDERDRLAARAVETEALRRSDEAKTTLLRAVGHDLRTPLTAIVGGAAALASPSLDPDEREALARGTEAASRRLEAMIDKLLDLSRIDTGSARPNREAMALDELVRDVVDEVPGAADRVRLEVASPPPDALVDATQVTRVLANLVENALLHGGDGDVLVRVGTRGDRAVVRVVDRGPGIGRDRLDRIFLPFERGSAAAAEGTDAASGSGLGLAIARGFAALNDGELHAESYPGQGATFVLSLPLAQRPPADPAPAGAVTDAAAARDAAGSAPRTDRRA